MYAILSIMLTKAKHVSLLFLLNTHIIFLKSFLETQGLLLLPTIIYTDDFPKQGSSVITKQPRGTKETVYPI